MALMGPSFLPTLCKFCILLHCQALHTEVNKENSTKFCDMLGSESDLQMHAKNSGVHPRKKGELKLFCDCSYLDKTMSDDENRARVPKTLAIISASRIWWRRIATVNETVEIKTLVSRGPRNYQLAVASHRAALSGNWQYIVNCHLF